MFVPKVKRDKLDQKVEVCIFVRYNSAIKGYSAYNPHKTKVIIRENVKFNEQSAWN